MQEICTAISALLAGGATLDEATLEIIAQGQRRPPGPEVFGPHHAEVRDLLGRLGRLSEKEARAAEHVARAWGQSDREPHPVELLQALLISGQTSTEAREAVVSAVTCIRTVSEAPAVILGIGLQAMMGAHLLTTLDFDHWTQPLAAALGPVPMPVSPLTAPVPGCGRPVGQHLWSWPMTRHTCSCERPLPGLSVEGTLIAKSIANGSTDWLGCLAAAERLDPRQPT